MKSIRKKLQARASAARASLDATILSLRDSSLDQLLAKIDDAKTRLGREKDMAWNLAAGVLKKVRAVRESLTRAAVASVKAKPAQEAKRSVKIEKAKAASKARPARKTAKKARKRR